MKERLMSGSLASVVRSPLSGIFALLVGLYLVVAGLVELWPELDLKLPLMGGGSGGSPWLLLIPGLFLVAYGILRLVWELMAKSTRDSVDIAIQAERPAEARYPGGELQGTITLQSAKKINVQKVTAALVYREEFQYDETAEEGETQTMVLNYENPVAESTLMEGGPIPARFDQSFPFAWQIPSDAPPPYASHRSSGVTRPIQTRWLVRVTLDRKVMPDIIEQYVVPLVVPPPGRHNQPGEYGQDSRSNGTGISFSLPGREWVEGETVEGQLLVRPEAELDARSARLELIRVEHTHAPRREEKNARTLAQLDLAGETRFAPGQSSEIPFALAIPRLGSPTLRTQNATVTWVLRGVLDRSRKKDRSVSTEVEIHNGPARDPYASG